MYAVYNYLTGATQANILSDVVAILTGTTDVNTLSASCDKATTTITTTYYPAGWTVHDAAAATNKVCLKAATIDDPTQFKYLLVGTAVSGKITMVGYDSWNETNHTGTYSTFTDSDYTTYLTASAGIIHIWSSARYAVIYTPQGSSAGTFTGQCCLEFARVPYTWCAIGTGYTPFVVGSASTIYYPRTINIGSGAANMTGSASSAVFFYMLGAFSTAQSDMFSSSSATQLALISDVWLDKGVSSSNRGGVICDIKIIAASGGTALDEITYNGQTWQVLPIAFSALSTVPRLLARKG